MATHNYDPNTHYPPNDTFRITGESLNDISARIRELKQEVKDLKDEAIQDELENLRIRDKNPTVRDAWDKYQTILTLARKK